MCLALNFVNTRYFDVETMVIDPIPSPNCLNGPFNRGGISPDNEVSRELQFFSKHPKNPGNGIFHLGRDFVAKSLH